MKLAALPTLIAAGESQTLEFKASFDKACIATLVAFANAQGGTVLVGVSDAGVVTVGKETFAQKQPESPDEGVSEGVNSLMQLIRASSGLRTPALAEALHTSPKNIERWLKQLKENGLIEFRGATKTGGYHAVAAKPAPPKGSNKT